MVIGDEAARRHRTEVPPLSSPRLAPRLAPRSDRRPDPPAAGALLGIALVAAGLSLAFLTVETPLASRLVTGGWSGTSQLPFAAIVWFLGIVAGGALLVAGTDRLAAIVAALRVSAA